MRAEPEYVAVTILASEPGGEYPHRPPAAAWWPVGVQLPEVGDLLRIGESGSPIQGETVEILERTWVYASRLYGYGASRPTPGVILELRAQVRRAG